MVRHDRAEFCVYGIKSECRSSTKWRKWQVGSSSSSSNRFNCPWTKRSNSFHLTSISIGPCVRSMRYLSLLWTFAASVSLSPFHSRRNRERRTCWITHETIFLFYFLSRFCSVSMTFNYRMAFFSLHSVPQSESCMRSIRIAHTYP